ncbi:ribose transport system substrate-binding protein [Candidatus Magnetomoraceae bacterium gMMP-15]
MAVKTIYLVFCCIFILTNSAVAENHGKIALVMKALSNPFFLKMESGAKEYAVKNNIPFEVFGVERETEIERQIGIVDNLISRGYGAIVIAPADSKKLVPVCKKALEQGIVIINIDNPFHKETLKIHNISIPFVGSSNYNGASMVGNYIKQKLNGKGKVVVIEGIQGVENADLRKKGFIDAVTSNSEIKIVASESANWHTDEAFSLTARILQEHGKIDAIFCANDNMALGAVQFFDMFGIAGQVLVGGYDNIEEVRNEMFNKRIHVTIEQHPELMGQFGVKLAARAVAGEKISDFTSTPLDLITYESFDKTIALSISYMKNSFFASITNGAKRAAELFGVKLAISDADNDDAKQLFDIQKFIQKKVDLIIINPTNAETVSPAIKFASAAGIKIITVDRKSLMDDIVISHIASDNIAGGRIAGEFIAEQLGGRGNVLELEGIPGTSVTYKRGMGFNEALKKYPEIKITAREVAYFDYNKAKKTVIRLLKQGLSFDAVFAHNDNMILGAIEAFEKSAKKKSFVSVGFDAIPKALQALSQKRLTATIAQKPESMGWLAVKNAVSTFRGKNLPSVILVDLKLIK